MCKSAALDFIWVIQLSIIAWLPPSHHFTATECDRKSEKLTTQEHRDTIWLREDGKRSSNSNGRIWYLLCAVADITIDWHTLQFTTGIACKKFYTMICLYVHVYHVFNTAEIIHLSLFVCHSSFLWIYYRKFKVVIWFQLDFQHFFNLNKYNVTQINSFI